MNVTFRCPHCDELSAAEFDAATEFACSACAARFHPAEGAVADGNVTQCLICPCRELYVRKDFSQTVGVGIVAAGMIISSIFWFYRMPFWTYATLFASALLDVVLYVTVGNVLQCYQCQAQYRGLKALEEHEGFDLEIHEKHRQQQIRLARVGTPPPRK